MIVGVSLVVYVVVLFAIAFWARGRIEDATDYVVAGRRLPLSLASATLFATWFGAGTLLASADEARHEGLRAMALDPLGAGGCLLLAGFFFAGPLYRRRLLTLADFFRERFGPRAEVVGGVLLTPGYFGWIAAQFVALASMLELTFHVDFTVGLVIVALVGTGYTLIGGMWSVTVTDAFQMVLLLVGLVLVAWVAFGALAGGDPVAGLARLAHDTPPALLEPVPTEKATAFLGWLGLLAAGSLGNIPSQDLVQRIFASRSERVARQACYLAGGGYLVFGVIPPLLGLTARLLAPDGQRAILPLLAGLVLHPLPAVIFVLAVVSAVLSTIDSAILAPASVLAQNVFARTAPERLAHRLTPLGWNQLSVVLVAGASLAVAFVGENAYSLLESAYEIGLVSLLVPLAVGLYSRRGGEGAALAAMGVGTTLWLVHLALGWHWFAAPLLAGRGIFLPMGLSCAALALCAYAAAALPSRP